MDTIETARAALRESALTFLAANTGLTTLGCTTAGFTRSAGSFLTDGFRPGHEVVSAGFAGAASGTFVLKSVTDLLMEAENPTGLTTQAAAGGRQITCPWLARAAWENWPFDMDPARPYVREKLVPQEQTRTSIGPNARVQVGGTWMLDFFFPANVKGTVGPGSYVGTLCENHFYPGRSLVRNNQQILVISSTRSAGRSSAGWYMIPVVLRFKTFYTTPQ